MKSNLPFKVKTCFNKNENACVDGASVFNDNFPHYIVIGMDPQPHPSFNV